MTEAERAATTQALERAASCIDQGFAAIGSRLGDGLAVFDAALRQLDDLADVTGVGTGVGMGMGAGAGAGPESGCPLADALADALARLRGLSDELGAATEALWRVAPRDAPSPSRSSACWPAS